MKISRVSSGNMLPLLLVVSLVAAAFGSVPYVRTREEIAGFKEFLDRAVPSAIVARRNVEKNPKAFLNENSGLYQGDILLTDEQKATILEDFATGGSASTKNGLIDSSTLWPDNTLVYDYADQHFDASEVAIIERALAEISSRSCVRFRRRTVADTSYVLVTGQPSGCWAHIGYLNGVQALNLQPRNFGSNCMWHGIIIHEFLHALGFYHMQSNYNRDDWIRIMWSHITTGAEHNFNKYSENLISTFGTDYDYGSVMHYSAYAFSNSGQRTIEPRNPWTGDMGSNTDWAASDILKLNRMLRCPGHENW